MKRVFDLETSFEGRWLMDVAYPQWFYDAVTVIPRSINRTDLDKNPKSKSTKYIIEEGQTDWSVAINKAIEFKGAGEVHLPSGFYPILQSIIITSGITLKGIGDCWNTKTYYKNNGEDKVIGNDLGTYLMPAMTKVSWLEVVPGNDFPQTISGYANRFLFNCAIVVNVNPKILRNSDLTSMDLTDFLKYTETKEFSSQFGGVWESSYPKVTTTCQNFGIDNTTFPTSQIRRLKGIFVAGGANFEGLRFDCLQQSIVWSRDYADSKNVFHCYVSNAGNFHKPRISTGNSESDFGEKEILFAFNLQFLGDAMRFEHNSVEDGNQMALFVNNCGGGKIEGNILNADVEIWSCKGISYSFNHMEEGAQLRVGNSVVDITGNYIWKGDRPCIIIHSGFFDSESVISLKTNQYIYMNPDSITKKYSSSDTTLPKEEPCCEYDIVIAEIDPNGNYSDRILNRNVISLKNEFRYYNYTNVFSRNLTTGIYFGKVVVKDRADLSSDELDYEPFTDFNDASHYLSKGSSIDSCYKISDFSYNIKNINQPRYKDPNEQKEKEDLVFTGNNNFPWVSASLVSGNGKWLGELKNYKYFYSIIYFKHRGVIKQYKSNTVFPLQASDEYFDFTAPPLGELPYKDPRDKITLFNIKDVPSQLGGNFIVRIIRVQFNSPQEPEQSPYIQFIDVPICGSRIFYDTGLSINGFSWKEYVPDRDRLFTCFISENICGVNTIGDNVEVFSNVQPSILDFWKPGDKIYNMNPENTSWQMILIKNPKK